MRKSVLAAPAALALAAVPGIAAASFHLMQIEQVTGGVNGDSSEQAIQLRMRSSFQSQVQFAHLIVRDAAGQNPIMLIDFGSPVSNSSAGDRILVASPNFAAQQGPAPNFVMTNLIPPSYFAGGQIIFEQDGGAILWALCWGTYSGPTGVFSAGTNDADGNFGPCEPGSLPSADLTALQFTGAASALSTNNAADYAVTAGTATFTNNAGVAAALLPPLLSDGFE